MGLCLVIFWYHALLQSNHSAFSVLLDLSFRKDLMGNASCLSGAGKAIRWIKGMKAEPGSLMADQMDMWSFLVKATGGMSSYLAHKSFRVTISKDGSSLSLTHTHTHTNTHTQMRRQNWFALPASRMESDSGNLSGNQKNLRVHPAAKYPDPFWILQNSL